MKKYSSIFVVLVVLMAVLALASCGSGGTKTQSSNVPAVMPPAESVKTAAIPAPVVVAIPEAIGVSKPNVKFTPYPDCDGGECYNIEFAIGVRLKGKAESLMVHISRFAYARKVGGAKKDPEYMKAKRLHDTLSSIDPKKVSVTLIGDKVTKIVLLEEWQGNKFAPEEVLWEEEKK